MRHDLGRGPWSLVDGRRGWGRIFGGEPRGGGIKRKFPLEALPE
jgi:hypothetical protein